MADPVQKPLSLIVLMVILVLHGVTALASGMILIIDPSGALIQLPREVLHTYLFQDFLVPGLFLFTFLGVLPLISAYALSVKSEPRWLLALNIYDQQRVGWMLALFSGFGTLIWIIVQLYLTETYDHLQTVYSVIGLLILVLALWPATMRHCRR